MGFWQRIFREPAGRPLALRIDGPGAARAHVGEPVYSGGGGADGVLVRATPDGIEVWRSPTMRFFVHYSRRPRWVYPHDPARRQSLLRAVASYDAMMRAFADLPAAASGKAAAAALRSWDRAWGGVDGGAGAWAVAMGHATDVLTRLNAAVGAHPLDWATMGATWDTPTRVPLDATESAAMAHAGEAVYSPTAFVGVLVGNVASGTARVVSPGAHGQLAISLVCVGGGAVTTSLHSAAAREAMRMRVMAHYYLQEFTRSVATAVSDGPARTTCRGIEEGVAIVNAVLADMPGTRHE